jgi:putative spermidine/putrescine transport system permease protein
MIARPSVKVDGVGIALGVALLLVLLFMAMPIILIVVNSFNREHYSVFPPPGFSLRWYGNITRVPNLGTAALNSFGIAVAVSVLTQLVGILAAYGLARYRYRGLQAWRTLFLSPLVVPRVAFGVAAFIFFLRVRVLEGWWPFVFVHLLVALPFAIAVLSASLVHIPRETEEAAMDLGAHPIRMFTEVTLPQMRTALVISTLFSFIISWDQLDTSLFLARPGQTTLPVEMLFFTEQQQDPTLAALSTLLILASLLLLVLGIIVARPREVSRMVARGQTAGPEGGPKS